MFPGAPIKLRFPPIAAARTNGSNNLEREKPDFCAIPTTTGINTAAVPVLERTPDIKPVMAITAIISCRSVFANLVTRPPTF
ncbi:hypothetical protein SDC9_64676 [bioreactor metagenome]|uniref:Uncharacterized protein n=1 Tax=bioreactor metagenome TaxID=1076179 RepID=A0A644XPY4_9ZZZZ